jgi:hypothetical protein
LLSLETLASSLDLLLVCLSISRRSQSLHLLGGALSNPAKQYPSVFGNIQFFKDYPYALPTFVASAIGATVTIICALFVKEVRNTHANI